MERCDFLVIGAGMAGSSAAYELSKAGTVILLEREDTPGYHSTGRSAATFTEAYGNRAVRGLTCASRAFYENPPPGFTETPLLSPRSMLFFGRADQTAALDLFYEETNALVPSVTRLDERESRERVPVLREGYVAGGVLEPDAKEIDVAALHQGYLAGMRANGGKLVTTAEVKSLANTEGVWRAETTAGQFEAPIVINAAGAWCDVVAKLAGVPPIGLVPKRRTAFIFDAPDDVRADNWPLFADVDEDFYVKPDGGRLMGSPADETPMEPCDVFPEEIDIAVAADRIMKATTIEIRHIRNKWAGLRSFVPDKTLVAGFEPGMDGFFWLAGQGGYGIQTAPAMSRIAAALATGQAYPETVAAFGTTQQDLTPARFR